MQGKEATFQFLEAVLQETLDLFPFNVIHIGGDEVRHCSRAVALAGQCQLLLGKLMETGIKAPASQAEACLLRIWPEMADPLGAKGPVVSGACSACSVPYPVGCS